MYSCLARMGIAHTLVKVVPFSHDIVPDTDPEGKVFVYGSTALSNKAVANGWFPGSFLNENHDYTVWSHHYRPYLLNDGTICRFGDVNPNIDQFFIRPCSDDKTFPGMLTDKNEFKAWQRKVLDLHETYTTLDADTLVVWSEPKTIYAEYRFWIVRGKIVTSSMYKRGDRVHSSNLVDDDVHWFACTMPEIWNPAIGYCLDVAQTPEGCKIIEINCLNSAGLYAADVGKLIQAIEEL